MGTHLVPFRELGSVEEGRQSPRPYHDSGVFPTPAIHAALMALYDAKLVQWPVPFEELDVPTSHGTTHVVVSGPEDGESVILIHMAGLHIAPQNRARTHIRNAEVEIIANGTHAVHIEASHRVSTRVLEFLDQGGRT